MRVLILVLIICFSAGLAFAHPPTNIEANINAQKVEVTVTHPVANPQKHFIKEIEVKLNGEKIIVQNFSLQVDENVQKAAYFIPSLKAKDMLEIEAECNISGKLSKSFEVK